MKRLKKNSRTKQPLLRSWNKFMNQQMVHYRQILLWLPSSIKVSNSQLLDPIQFLQPQGRCVYQPTFSRMSVHAQTPFRTLTYPYKKSTIQTSKWYNRATPFQSWPSIYPFRKQHTGKQPTTTWYRNNVGCHISQWSSNLQILFYFDFHPLII